MAAKKVTYEVRYLENGYWHQVMSSAKQEIMAIHKANPGSLFFEHKA